MRFSRAGGTGLSLSKVMYGNLRYPGDADRAELVAHTRAALDAGITSFDTADIYGIFECERALGEALSSVDRSTVEIMTKVSFPVGEGPNNRGLSRKHVTESVESALERLRTDHIDVLVAHRYDEETPLEETMSVFSDLVRAGKVLYMGVSEWEVPQLEQAAALAAELRVPLATNMVRYSLLWREAELEIIPACRRLGIGVVPYFPLEQGVLTGKYRPGASVPAGTRAAAPQGGRAPVMEQLMTEDVLKRVEMLRPLADEAGLSVAQFAIAWSLSNPAVTGVTVGASRPEQLAENALAAETDLSPEAARRAEEILGPVTNWSYPEE